MQQIRKEESAFKQFLIYIQTVGIASAVQKIITNPLERYKILQQAQNVMMINERTKYKSFSAYISRIPKEQGLKAFFRGTSANILISFNQAFTQSLFVDNIQRSFLQGHSGDYWDPSTVGKKFLAAFTGGFFTLLFTHPFDTIKTRMCLDFAKNKQDRLFRSIFQTISTTRENQGFLSLYSGFLITNITNIPYFMALYASIDILQNTKQIENQEVKKYLGNVGIAALFSHLVTYPLDTIKRRMQINGYNRNPIYKNSFECFKVVQSKEGISSLYKGATVSSVKYILSLIIHINALDFIISLKNKQFFSN